eukprot:TRINITY_DN37713_c0_g1_i2.p1 TRINITY_DN37713_c0_g1~~TRINITY_DN37713_c0_g1_i2.p1  ORF type:complete len:541 (+),score=87.52 TRINITY_DN37713_c0_g1_i2:3-1625(+)
MFDSVADRRLSLSPSSTIAKEVLAQGVPTPSRNHDAKATKEGPLGEELILQNGLRIFLKNTDLFDDEIIVSARRWGGLTEFQETNMMGGLGNVSCEAQTCSMAAMMLGICGLDVESLQECLDGKRVDPSPPALEAYSTCLDLSSSPPDLEALLQLTALLFLKPVEAGGVKAAGRLSFVKLGLLAWRLAEDRDPSSHFRRRVQSAVSSNHPYTSFPSLWRILRLNFAKACTVFNGRVSQPREWTFVFCGRLPAREILVPLLEQYLGCIPNADASQAEAVQNQRRSDLELREAVTPLDIKFPNARIREDVHLNMVEPKGSTVVVFPLVVPTAVKLHDLDSARNELRDLLRLRMLVSLLETRLIEVLRFQRGQVYGVSVSDDLGSSPPQLGIQRKGTLSIGFECDPAESDELVEATLKEIQNLRDGSSTFTSENVSAALEQEKRDFEERTNTNSWWAGTILDLYFSRCFAVCEGKTIGDTMSTWWQVHKEVNESFNEDQAMKAFKDFLPQGSSSVVVAMRPKGKSAKKPENSATRSQDGSPRA